MPSILSDAPKLEAPKPLDPSQDARDFDDVPTLRKTIFNRVLETAQTLPAMENARHRLSLVDVGYEGPEEVSKAERKKAVLEGRTLARRMRGTWLLSDLATGKTLDRKRTTVAQVPYLTDSGTFVHNGGEYVLSNQLRLNPGIFTRIKENGQIEAHANLLPGEGLAHRYRFDPEKSLF